MAAQLSRLLTVTTVVLLLALLILPIANRMTPVNLQPWRNAAAWGLGVLIPIRLLAGVRSWRSKIAGPLAGPASIQSQLYGFTPGSSAIEDSSGPAHTTSEIEPDDNLRPGQDKEFH